MMTPDDDDDWREGDFGSPPPGHNKPPEEPVHISLAKSAVKEAQKVATEILSISTKGQADMVAAAINAVKAAYRVFDKHRYDRVSPLNNQVAAINDEYRPLKGVLETVQATLETMNRRWLLLQDKLREEEAKRVRAEADEKARIALEAQQKAEAEAERAKDGDVTEGPLRPLEAAAEASQLTLDARKAEARAAQLEKGKVRSGGGAAGRAIGLKAPKEILKIANKTDLIKACREIGMNNGLPDLVIEAARSYRRHHNKLPPGITRTEEKE